MAAGSGRPSDVWDALVDLGRTLAATRGVSDEVTEALTETVGELRRVAMRDEAAVRMLAEALDMLVGMHRMARRLEVALPLAEERLTITRSLLAANPGPDQRRWCARALNQLGRTLDLLKRHHEALLAFREAVALAGEAKDAGLPVERDLAYYLFVLIRVPEPPGSGGGGAGRRGGEGGPGVPAPVGRPVRRPSSACGGPLRPGRRLAVLERWRAAASTVQEAVALYRQLAADESVGARYELPDALSRLRYYAEEAGLWPDAEAAAREEVALRRELPDREDTSDAVDLAVALRDLAWLLWRRGRSPEAGPLAWEAAERFRTLASASRLL
ncbi:MAG TPA: tetratricopeptide repeat protein [Actinomycetes bacterium]|nr:tetratricopeptide repeat protein [Actinomycetes bacterium]